MKTHCYSLLDNRVQEVKLKPCLEGHFEHPLINVYSKTITDIVGFGGAITESAAYNYSLLTKEQKEEVLEWLVGESGLRYNLFRICIGSSDFALDEFCYLENGDMSLNSFSIDRDRKYVIPFARDLMAHSKNEIKFLASPWSPPAWLKDNKTRIKGGKLLKEHYEFYADYVLAFLKAYEEEGIRVSYLTIQNEPKASQTWESCVFASEDEIELAKVLNKKLKEAGMNVSLLGWDHNKERLVERGSAILDSGEFSGVAFHWYSGNHFDAISIMRNTYPKALLLETEFCKTVTEAYTEVDYSAEYLNVIRRGGNGLIDWNLILDENGGPHHNRRAGCNAALRLDSKTGTIRPNELYGQIYMFSHFIKEGAKSLYTSSFDERVKASAM